MRQRPWERESQGAELLSRLGSAGCAGRGAPAHGNRPPKDSATQHVAKTGRRGDDQPRSATQQHGRAAGAGGPSRSAAQQLAIEQFIEAHPILPFLESQGVELRRVGRTNGGEWAGPCPLCGGRDRLRVWPTPTTGRPRAWCRQCGCSGDALAWATQVGGRDPRTRGSIAETLRDHGYLRNGGGRRA